MYKKYYKKRSNFHWLENFIILLIIGFICLIVYLNFDGISDVLRFDDTEENFTEVEQTSNTVFNYDVQSNSVTALEVITPDSTNIGSGTIIEKEVFTGYYQYTVLTNAHVINNYQDIKVVYKDSAGDYVRITDVNVVRSDDTLDLALLTFNSDISFYPVTIQDGPAVIGEDVYAIGTDLFFLFYLFWEIMLLPMYFLIGIWGGPRKEYAAIKFFLYTLFGSVFMLLVMVALYFAAGSFNLLDMMNPDTFKDGALLLDPTWRLIAFAALFVGFAIKVPIVPFHTWLPDAHVEAPTPISVILAGVLLKMGTYGMLRISWPIFPEAVAYFQDYIAFIGMFSIVYGALCALGQHKFGQKDLKKMIAYSSVSHMGYVMLGMAAMNTEGMAGAIFQMFNHGTITAMLFMIVGVIYDRAHTRGLEDFGGLANKMPVYTGIMTIAWFAAIGLPGMSGFVSEVMIFLGAFQTYIWYTILAATGIVIGAAYMLWALQKVWFGKLPEKWSGPWDPTGEVYKHDDINGIELAGLVPLAIVVIYLGINPAPIVDMMNTSVNHLIEFVKVSGQFASVGL